MCCREVGTTLYNLITNVWQNLTSLKMLVKSVKNYVIVNTLFTYVITKLELQILITCGGYG